MATPTWAEAATQLTETMQALTDLYADLPTLVTTIDTAEQALEGDFLPNAYTAELSSWRRNLSDAIAPERAYRIWVAWLREVCRIANLPEGSSGNVVDMAARVHRYMHDNSYTFNDRNLTVAATGSAGGSNVGNGTLSVLAVDWEGYNLQCPTAETKTWECVRDQNLGQLKGNEVFQVRGQDRSKDWLDWTGSGILTTAYAMHAGSGTGGSVLRNSSWDSAFSGTGTDKIPGWTIAGTASKITADTSNTYRAAPGASTSQALAFENDAAATNQVYQALSSTRISALGERTPWQCQVAYKHSAGSITGTLNVKLGNQTLAVDLSGATTAWQIASLPYDKNLYYRNWKEDAPDIEVEVVNLSAGTLYVDDLIFAPLTLVDGLWWWLVGGSTAFLQRDLFTHAVSGGAAADAEMMFMAFWAAMANGRRGIPWFSFPTDNGGTETISDP